MSSVSNFKIGLCFFGGTLVVATIGYVIAGWPVLDSIYMVIITVFGVGFGEVRPIDTPGLRIFTMGVIVAGTTAEVYTLGGLIQMVTQGEIRQLLGARRMRSDIEKLTGHVIICGYGRIGQVLAGELSADERGFVILDASPERVAMAQEHGHLAMQANATDEQALVDAGVARAAVLATVLPDDVLNVYITLSARDLNRDLLIIARGELPGTHKKLTQAGANQVVLPTMIGAQRMASLIRRPVLDEVLHDTLGRQRLDEDLSRLGVRMQELPIVAGSAAVGKTIGQIEVGAGLIVGIRHSHGATISNPSAEMLLSEGDALLVLGHADKLPAFIDQMVKPKTDRYRGSLR